MTCGYIEAQARERGYGIKVGRFPFQANGKVLGPGDYAGWVKIVMDEKYGEILGARSGGNADRYLANETSEFFKNSEVYLIIQCYPLSFVKPIFPHPQPADLLLGDMNMEHTLVTHSALGVIRCLQGADG